MDPDVRRVDEPDLAELPAADAGVVVAVVVTFEEPERLGACLTALLGQEQSPGAVVVVNNGKPLDHDVARQFAEPLGTSGVRVVLLEGHGNVGPAGGFALGIDRACSLGASWLWLLDDDFVMPPHALGAMLKLGEPEQSSVDQSGDGRARGPGAATATARMVWPSQFSASGELENYPGWCGVLVSRTAIERAGLPRAELVWWIEDTEYLQWRLPRSGVEQLRAVDVRVVHGDGRPDTYRPPWKTYYEIRNTVWYRLRLQRRRRLRLLRVLTVTLGQSLLSGRDRPRRFVAWCRGVGDGVRGRLGLRYRLPG